MVVSFLMRVPFTHSPSKTFKLNDKDNAFTFFYTLEKKTDLSSPCPKPFHALIVAELLNRRLLHVGNLLEYVSILFRDRFVNECSKAFLMDV